MTSVTIGGRAYHLGRINGADRDPRDSLYPARSAARLQSVRWHHNGPVLDQGDLGACTGYALTQALNTEPLTIRMGADRLLTADDARRIYSAATRLDPFRGVWPPNDTGSTGKAVCRAARKAGLLEAYTHADDLSAVLHVLTLQPVLLGLPWTQSMCTPSGVGQIRPRGTILGGHEVVAVELDVERERVWVMSSWGPMWGRHGEAWLTWADLGALLGEGGDCTVPAPAHAV